MFVCLWYKVSVTLVVAFLLMKSYDILKEAIKETDREIWWWVWCMPQAHPELEDKEEKAIRKAKKELMVIKIYTASAWILASFGVSLIWWAL